MIKQAANGKLHTGPWFLLRKQSPVVPSVALITSIQAGSWPERPPVMLQYLTD